MSKKSNIISKNTLPFKRDSQKGGVLFGTVQNPLKELFSSIGTISSNKMRNQSTNNFVKATKSNKLNSSRKSNLKEKKYEKAEGGFLTNHFFPTGYSSTSTSLSLQAKMKGGKKKK
jgi:hypothetical protein